MKKKDETLIFEKIKPGAYAFGEISAYEKIKDFLYAEVASKHRDKGIEFVDEEYKRIKDAFFDDYEVATITYIYKKNELPLEIRSVCELATEKTNSHLSRTATRPSLRPMLRPLDG